MFHQLFRSRSYQRTSGCALFSLRSYIILIETQENDSLFHVSLIDWRELNLSPAFVRFAGKADGLSTSMAMLLHNWKEIVDLWLEAVDSADDEALKPLLECVSHLYNVEH